MNDSDSQINGRFFDMPFTGGDEGVFVIIILTLIIWGTIIPIPYH